MPKFPKPKRVTDIRWKRAQLALALALALSESLSLFLVAAICH